MQVRCERDKRVFSAEPEKYPTAEKPTKMYDKDGDQFIECPDCHRRYFHYNGGSDLEPGDTKTGWHADRALTILKS